MAVFINHVGTYNDNHKEYNIDARGKDLASILRACEAEDIQAEEVKSEDSKPADKGEIFRHITHKCISQNQVERVDAEIRAACKGTAEGLWRTLWDNENMGYVAVEHIDATTLYRDIEQRYGKLPFKERQFRSARNNR